VVAEEVKKGRIRVLLSEHPTSSTKTCRRGTDRRVVTESGLAPGQRKVKREEEMRNGGRLFCEKLSVRMIRRRDENEQRKRRGFRRSIGGG